MRYLAEQDIVESRYGRDSKTMQGGGDRYRVAIKIVEPRAAIGNVNGDCHIEFLRLVIDRIKIRIRKQARTFHRPHQYRASAVLLAKANLIQRIGHAQSRGHTGPAQAIFTLAPNISEPPVPALA